jgi:hypothetical protein
MSLIKYWAQNDRIHSFGKNSGYRNLYFFRVANGDYSRQFSSDRFIYGTVKKNKSRAKEKNYKQASKRVIYSLHTV